MKKIIALALAALMIVGCTFSLASCADKTDVEKIKANGKLVVGVTDYAPFDYQETAGGKWVGFDADMARKVGEKLGVEVEFVEINWEQKITELKSGAIDVIWNGMTMTDELGAEMDFSYAYAENCQVAVIKSTDSATYTSLDSMKSARVVCEKGSAGEDAAVEQFGESNVTGLDSQVKALGDLKNNASDVAIVDYSLAKSLCGKGDYANLVIVAGTEIGKEQFAVGIRKGSDLTAVINEVLVAAYKGGDSVKLQNQYGANEDGSNSIALIDLSGK